MPETPVIMPEGGQQEANVNSPSLAYQAMEKMRELPRALMGGTQAMRKAGAKYLPQEPAETSMAWEIRVSRSVLYNAYRKAVQDLVGMVFSKPLTCKDETPDDLAEWCENIDLAGSDIHSFAKEVFTDAFYGVSYILVDFPRVAEGGTLDDERKVGARPYCVHVKSEDLIGFKSQLINGVQTLTEARIRETSVETSGPYSEKIVKRVRLLQIIEKDGAQHCAFTAHQLEDAKDKDGKEIWTIMPELSGVMSIDFIPIVPIYTGRTDFMLGVPPLADLADLNALHWRSSSDQENTLHFIRFPLLFGCGLGDDDSSVEIGPNHMIKASSPEAKLSYVEHTGAAVKSGKESLDDLESRMNRMAMEPTVVGKTGTITATEKAIDTSEAHSTLQSWALLLAGSLKLTLQYMGAWVGKAKAECGGVNVNTDYGLFMSGLELPQLLQAFQGGLLSKETVWNELKRRGLLADDFDPVEEAKLLEDDSRQKPGPVAPGGSIVDKLLAAAGHGGTAEPGAPAPGTSPIAPQLGAPT